MSNRIKLHIKCIAHSISFHTAGIVREIKLATYVYAPVINRVVLAIQ